jgi:hypothetical protein
VILALILPAGVAAQSFRGWVQSTGRYFQLPTVSLDTVPRSSVDVAPNGALTFEGRSVSCVTPNSCTLYRPGSIEETVTFTQDLGLTAWGLGMRGLSVTTLLRGRARGGGDVVWPRSDDAFDAMLAYAQLDRGAFRVRAGRIQTSGGLGFRGFDGASVMGRRGRFRLEGYGGRSLSRGLSEPRTEALRGVEDYVTESDAWLIGGSLQLRLPRQTSVGARYQREILSDRSVLISERASLDVRTGVLGTVRFTGSLDYDLAFGRVGKGSASFQYILADASLLVEATARRYVPYFDLSTIWGYFSPVAYHGGELRVSWWKLRTFGLWASGGWRRYDDTSTVVVLQPLTDSGWRTSAGASFRPGGKWVVDGSYRLESGNGAFLSSGDLTLRWSDTRLDAALTGMAFQQMEEFRVGDGRAYGGGLTLGYEVLAGTRLTGGGTIFWHRPRNRTTERDWNQFRAWTAVRIEIGRDPGQVRTGR